MSGGSMEPGERVLALRNATATEVFVFGEGTYLGELTIPPGTPTPIGVTTEANTFKNVCIQLDDGALVWGCQCWWGPVEMTRQKFAGRTLIDLPASDRPANPPLPDAA